MNNLLPVEQKGCRKNSRGTKDQLLIDKMVLDDCKKRHTKLGMAWIDYEKAYNMIPHSWILESLGLVQVAENIVGFIRKSIKNRNTNLTSCGEYLANVNISRGIFQGDSLSPLLFVISMIPLSQILRKLKSGYTLKNGEKLNHLLFMDDLKIFAKSEREISGLISTVQILSNDIGMEFGIKKCGVLVLKRGKVVSCEGVEMPDGERIKKIEKNGYRYLGILEYNKIKENKMKENFRREYLRRTKLIMKSKLSGRNKIIAINTRAVSLMRYGAGIVKWTKNELDEIDRKTRKVLTLNKEFYPRSDIDSLYVSRMEGGRGLIGCKMCVKAEENSLGWYVKHHIEPLIAARISNTVPSENSTPPKEFKQQHNEERLNNWRGKKMYGQYIRKIEDKDKSNTWKWLRKSSLKGCTEAKICSAQEQALRMNYVKFDLDKTGESPLCRMCRVENETVSHIVSECKMLAQKEYKKRHDNVCRYIHWKLCEKHDFQGAQQWYEHEPDGVIENKGYKILLDFTIQCDTKIEARRPDIVLIDKTMKEVKIVDVTIPGDERVNEREVGKIEKYKLLKDEIARMWDMKEVIVIPVVVGALGAISTGFEKYIAAIGIEIRV